MHLVPSIITEPFDPGRVLRAVPPTARMRGLFFNDVLAALPGPPVAPRLKEMAAQTYRTFLQYPHRDWLELLTLVAAEAHSTQTLGEGLRRIGRSAYSTFTTTMFGRAVFGIAGDNIHTALRLGPKGFSFALPIGTVRSTRQADHWVYEFARYPSFIDTYCVGVIEGVLTQFGVAGEIWVSKRMLFTGKILVKPLGERPPRIESTTT